MKTNKFLTAMMAICFAIAFSSCSKDDDSSYQPAGNYLTNNGVVSSSISVSPGNWSSDGNGGWLTTFVATGFSNITQAAISIYWSTDNTNFSALPFVGDTMGAPDINYSLNSSTISVFYDAQTGVPNISQPATTIYFNVVVVPQAVMKQHPHTNWKDYAQVQAIIEAQKHGNN